MTIRDVASIQDAVRQRQYWGIETLQQLIAIDSIAPNEEVCQLTLADILRQQGLEVELLPLDDGTLTQTEGFLDTGLPLANRPNLVAHYGDRKGTGKSLILNSHIDTVTWEHSVDQWQIHPLSGAVIDGKLYGRGAMDAKGQVMSALVAVMALKDLGYQPSGHVLVQSVVSEEPDGNGTLALCAQGYVADGAINLEATENQLAYGHRGIIGLRYKLSGEVRHASVRGNLTNVIVQAGKLAHALDHSLDVWSHPSDAVYSPPTVNIGRITGGDDIFTTPYGCTLDCGIRYAPVTYQDILSTIEEALQREAEHLPPLPSVHDAVFMHVDASHTPMDHPFMQMFQGAIHAIEPDSNPITFPAACDVRHLINRYQMPACIFGPGELHLAHAENEYLDLAQWERASQILALFITKWCK